MAAQVRLGGTWNVITAAQVFAGGAWRMIKAIQVYTNGAWRTVANFTPAGPSGGGAGAMTLSVAPNPCAGTSFSSTVTTRPCSVTPSGGQAPFTYSWSMASGSATINTPSFATTSFTKSGVATDQSISAVAKCDVTDSLGVHASITVDLSFFHDIADHSGTQ